MRCRLNRLRWIAIVWMQGALITACSSRPTTLDDAAPPVTCRWHTMSSGTTEDLWAIWGSGPGDVFVVGTIGTVLHFDGGAWSPMTGPPKRIASLWGSGPANVYGVAYSAGDNVFRCDGNAWTVAHSGPHGLLAIWGSSPDDVYAVGSSGTIVHFARGQWHEVSAHDSSGIRTGVWGSGPNNVYIVGRYGTVTHYNGSAWKRMNPGVTGDSFQGVTGLGPKQIYVLATATVGPEQQWYLLQHDGAQWHRVDLPPAHRQSAVQSMGTWGRELVLGLDAGLLLLYDGQTWREEKTGAALSLRGIWSPGPDEIFVTGDKGTILHYYCPS